MSDKPLFYVNLCHTFWNICDTFLSQKSFIRHFFVCKCALYYTLSVRISVQSYVQTQHCCKNNLYNFALCIV